MSWSVARLRVVAALIAATTASLSNCSRQERNDQCSSFAIRMSTENMRVQMQPQAGEVKAGRHNCNQFVPEWYLQHRSQAIPACTSACRQSNPFHATETGNSVMQTPI